MKNLLTILIFSIFIWSCNDDGGKLFSSINLESPLEITVDYCDVAFAWKARNIDGNFIIEIATDNNFENIVLTDSTTSKSYSTDGNLQPNQQYFWRIMADSESEIGSFTTTDESDLADFIGTFPATVHHYVPWGGPEDTTYTTTVQIDFENGIPQLISLYNNFLVEPEIFKHNKNCQQFFYGKIPNPIDPTVVVANNCTLDLQNRTFKFHRGHPSNHFYIYTEYTGSID
jgi:hypothetical protein